MTIDLAGITFTERELIERVMRNYPRPICGCSGYHFVHRRGSLCCEHHPRGFYNRAIREGGYSDEELLDVLLDCPGKHAKECPF